MPAPAVGRVRASTPYQRMSLRRLNNHDAVAALVGVPVLDHADHPLAGAVDLVPAVDDAVGVVFVVEVDDVVADEVDACLELAERADEPLPQRGAAPLVAPHLDVVDEEGHEVVDVSRVEGQAVAVGQLPDLPVGVEAV